MEYEHQIDELIIDSIRKDGSISPTKIQKLLINAYQKKSPTTIQKHLDKLTNTDLLERSKVKRRNNEQSYCLTGYAKRQLEYHGNIEPVISKRENRGGKRSKKELEDKVVDDEIVENNHNIFLNLLMQGSRRIGRLKPVSREKLSGEIDLPVFFRREEGVTAQDIVESRDVGNGKVFSHIKFTIPLVQKCIDVLEKNYGIDIEKHSYANANNTLEEYSAPAGSQPDDLVKRVERKVKDIGGNDDEIGVAIKDDNLRHLVNNIACLIFIVADRIKYTWLFKRKPRINSWEFNWHTTFFGRDKTLELIKKSKHTLPSLKNESNSQNLQDYIRKNVKNYWNGIGREDIDPTLIDSDIQHEFEVTLCKKENVDSLLQQTDRRIKNLYHERIKCDKYERIYCDQDHYDDDDDKCEKCQKFHDKYEEYCKFANDVVTNHDNKSNALIFPLIEIVYPRKLMKLHENQDKRRNKGVG